MKKYLPYLNSIFSRVEASPYLETIEDIYGEEYRTDSEEEMLRWVANEDNPENYYNSSIPESFRSDIKFARKACVLSGWIYSELSEEFKNDRGCYIALLESAEVSQRYSVGPYELQNDFNIYLEADTDKNFYWLADGTESGFLTNPLFREFHETGLDWTKENMRAFQRNKSLEKSLIKKEEKQPRRLKV